MTPEERSVSLTAQQRAEKICEIFRKKHAEDKGCACKEVAAEIREAVAIAESEAGKRVASKCISICEGRIAEVRAEAFAEGKRVAYKDAAKIADSIAELLPNNATHSLKQAEAIANMIRARARALNGTEGDNGSKETK